MSFAQGLLAGTQAARNVMDSYKEARDARIQREFAQGLTELDEQQKLNEANLQSYYSGANRERFAEAPTQAPTRFDQGLMPEAVPQAPLTPEQVVQQQLALANRLGLRQEAGNFTNQLNAMRQQQMEEQRYNQQGLFNEQKFEADEAFRAEQLRLDEMQRKATANWQDQQAEGLAAERAADALKAQRTAAADQARLDVRQATLSGGSIGALLSSAPEKFETNEQVLSYRNAVLDGFSAATGLKDSDIAKGVESVLAPLSRFIATSFKGENADADALAAFSTVLDTVDPDLTDGIKPQPVFEDGVVRIMYNGMVLPGLEGKDLQDVAAKYMTMVKEDPFEAVAIVDRNQQLQIQKLAAAQKAGADQKALVEIIKTDPSLLRNEQRAGEVLRLLGIEGGRGYDVPEGWGDGGESNVEQLDAYLKFLGKKPKTTTTGAGAIVQQVETDFKEQQRVRLAEEEAISAAVESGRRIAQSVQYSPYYLKLFEAKLRDPKTSAVERAELEAAISAIRSNPRATGRY